MNQPDLLEQASSVTYTRVGNALRAGLLISVAVMLAGLAVHLAHHAGLPTRAPTISTVAADLRRGRLEALLAAGILLLFCSPILGVVVALGEFVRLRAWVFAGVSSCLLVILAGGFAIALH